VEREGNGSRDLKALLGRYRGKNDLNQFAFPEIGEWHVLSVTMFCGACLVPPLFMRQEILVYDRLGKYIRIPDRDDPEHQLGLRVHNPDFLDKEPFSNQMCGPVIITSLNFLHCKNVVVETIRFSEKLRKRQRARGTVFFGEYEVLRIEPMVKILNAAAAESGDIRKAFHICRGHFKTFTEDRPLFGKHTGTYWWANQVRGDRRKGIIEKDYLVG